MRLGLIALLSTVAAEMGGKSSENMGLAPVIPPANELLDLAHDVDHGEEIVDNYGDALYNQWNHDVNSESGSVLSIALRNNPGAAKHFPYDLFGATIQRNRDNKGFLFHPRTLRIVSSLASTPQGLHNPQTQRALELVAKHLPENDLDRNSASKVVSLVHTLSHSNALNPEWVAAVQKSVVSASDDRARYELLKLASAMVSRSDEFENLEAVQPDSGLVSWLASATQSPPKSRDLQLLIKDVRHRVFGNPHASRNHFDEL